MIKFEIQSIDYIDALNYSSVNDYIDEMEDRIYPKIREVEKQRDKLFDALVRQTIEIEKTCLCSEYTEKVVELIEQISWKDWHSIKGLYK